MCWQKTILIFNYVWFSFTDNKVIELNIHMKNLVFPVLIKLLANRHLPFSNKYKPSPNNENLNCSVIYINEFSLHRTAINWTVLIVAAQILLLRAILEMKISIPGRSSQERCSVKKGVLKNFANFTGKHLCWSLFLIKFQAFNPGTLLKRDSNTGVFLWSFRNFKDTYFEGHCERLVLSRRLTSLPRTDYIW